MFAPRFIDIVYIVFLLAFMAAMAAAAIYWWWWERKRKEAFWRLARKLGLRYVSHDYSIPGKYSFLNALRRGRQRYASNVLRGTYKGHRVLAFDYHYRTGSGKSAHNVNFSFLLLEQEVFFPELRIYPEDVMSKLGQMIGFEDIDFESVEFSRAFVVRSRDRKFAYDVCHPRMMEFLLQHRDLSLEIEGLCVAISFPRRLKPEEIPERLRQLIEVRQLFPQYLYRA